MATAQITVRLSKSAKAEFDAYSRQLGLAASELAKLLVVRERHQKRLPTLQASAAASAATNTSSQRQRRTSKVTAHVSSPRQVAEFDAHARACGLDRNGAGVLLLEAELRERWLEKAIIGP